MNNGILTACLLAAMSAIILLSAGLAGRWDYEMQKLQQQEYCMMTKVWLEESAAGISESERRGWPTYRNDISCNY